LIHWLSRRLVEEQELASDALAATLAGGRRRYLRALTRFALRQDDRPKGWPGPIALPVSSRFLMRRIDMLRARDGSAGDRATKAAQWAFVAAVVLFSAGATAIRCAAQKPDEREPARVANRIVERSSGRDAVIRPTSKAPDRFPDQDLFQQELFDPSMLASEGSAVCVVRPAELFRRAELEPVRGIYIQALPKWMKEAAGDDELLLKVEEIELAAANLMIAFDKNGTEEQPHRIMLSAGPMMIRVVRPFDWTRLLLKLYPGTVQKEYRERAYLELPAIPAPGPTKINVYVPDDRTLLVGPVVRGDDDRFVQGMIDRHVDGPPRYDWTDQWAALDGGLMTIAFDNRQCRWLQVRGIEDDLWKPFAGPLLKEAQFVGIGADWSDATNQFVVQGRAISEHQEQSDRIREAVGTLLGMARMVLEYKELEDEAGKPMLGEILSMLKSASFERGTTPDGQAVLDGRIEAEVPVDRLRELLESEAAS
jgi:hypothetical protein